MRAAESKHRRGGSAALAYHLPCPAAPGPRTLAFPLTPAVARPGKGPSDDRQIDEACLVVNAKTAGTELRPADHWLCPKILRGGNQSQGAAPRAGEDGEENGLDCRAQGLGLGEQDDVPGVHRAERELIKVMQPRRL